MSATSHQHEQWYCNECGEAHPAHEFFSQAMCSRECEARDQVRPVLNTLKHDHRFCYTCGLKVKQVEKPNESWGLPECVVGYQYRTENGELGEKSPLRNTTASNRHFPTGSDQIYGYEVQDNGDLVEYFPGQSYDWRNEPDHRYDPTADVVGTGTICQCGQTDHKHADRDLRNRFPFWVGHNLLESIADLRSEGKVSINLDRNRFFQSLLDTYEAPIGDVEDAHRRALEAALVL